MQDNQDLKDIWNTQKWLTNQSLPPFSRIKAVIDRAFIANSVSAIEGRKKIVLL